MKSPRRAERLAGASDPTDVLTIACMVLIVVLAVAVISFGIMGLMQIRRTRALSREAGKLALRFSADDPFDVPRRYANFALIASGHSPRASNVTYGRLEGLPIRAFDFRCEVGHGTRRTTRHYGVLVVETDRELPEVLMWNDRDVESIPFWAMDDSRHPERWAYRGRARATQALRKACADTVGQEGSIQTCGTALMAFAPASRQQGPLAKRLTKAVQTVRAIQETLSRPAAEPDQEQIPPATARPRRDFHEPER